MLVVKTTSPATSPSPAKLHPSKTAPSSRTTFARVLPCSKSRPDSVVDHLSANYSTSDPTRQPQPEVRGVQGSTRQALAIHNPLLREVHEHQVRRRARLQRQLLPLGGGRRVGGRHEVRGPVPRRPRHARAVLLRSQGWIYPVE